MLSLFFSFQFVIWCFFLLFQFSFSQANLIWMRSKSCLSAARHPSNYFRRAILPGKLWWRHRPRRLAPPGSSSRAFGIYKLLYHHYPAVNNLCLFSLPDRVRELDWHRHWQICLCDARLLGSSASYKGVVPGKTLCKNRGLQFSSLLFWDLQSKHISLHSQWLRFTFRRNERITMKGISGGAYNMFGIQISSVMSGQSSVWLPWLQIVLKKTF